MKRSSARSRSTGTSSVDSAPVLTFPSTDPRLEPKGADHWLCGGPLVIPGAPAGVFVAPLVTPQQVQNPTATSESLFAEYEREIADRPEKLRDLLKVKTKFIERFPTVPTTWPSVRDFLNETYQGPTGRTRRNRFDSLFGLFQYGVNPLRILPFNPLEGARRPQAESRPANPLSVELLQSIHERAMAAPLRDQAVWLLRIGLGWRPVECERLLMGHVRQAFARNDGFIQREQKYRSGKVAQSPSPIVPEVLNVLRDLAEEQHDLEDSDPVFWGTSGRHQGRPLGSQGVRGIIRRLFEQVGVRQELPDAIPYDLRDSFATLVGRAVRASGGGTSEAQDVARRLLGHGDGSDSLRRYWDDDDRPEELSRFGPLTLLDVKERSSETEGPAPRAGGGVVEIGGLEPPASALRTRRSPS